MIGELMLNMQNNNMEDQDWNTKEDPIFDKFNKLTTGTLNRITTIDHKAKMINVDYEARSVKMNYQKISKKRLGKSIHSKEHIEKISKPVLQYDLLGNFIKEWNSAKEANLILFGKPKSGDISACCVGRQKTAYGFIWKFKLEQN